MLPDDISFVTDEASLRALARTYAQEPDVTIGTENAPLERQRIVAASLRSCCMAGQT